MSSSHGTAAILQASDHGDTRPRVCDNCIRQKVKCDRGRPQCSRCLERGTPCAYSSNRQKPGPTPGSKRGSQPRQSSSLRPRWRRADDHLLSDGQSNLPSPEASIPSTLSALSVPNPATEEPQPGPESLNISPEEEESLLDRYFETIHHSIPLFLDAQVPTGGGSGRHAVAGCSRDLVHTMIVITAKLSGFVFGAISEPELHTRMDWILSSASLQEEIAGVNPTIDQFRKSCLLVFYEFHQCPGQQAWMRIGKLVRWAYWSGLDRIEKLRQVSPPWNKLTEEELEEWRLVWWRVYCLDSYANVSTGMPYEIDEGLINTVLSPSLSAGPGRRFSLPYQQDGLLELTQHVLSESRSEAAAFQIQIISITILRHVGRMIRLSALGAHDAYLAVAADTERRLSALRLALPANFFNPRRNAFENESAFAHHFRLVTVHHMLMAQLLVTLGHCGRLPEGTSWVENWQQVLELCQDVAAIASQWNSSFCLSVDPALSIIAFISLVFLHLQIKFDGPNGVAENAVLRAEIEHCQTILLLFLEQFAKLWTLPRLLILSFKSFRESLTCPIGYRQIRGVLHHFDSPLHPRWLQFLQSADEILKSC